MHPHQSQKVAPATFLLWMIRCKGSLDVWSMFRYSEKLYTMGNFLKSNYRENDYEFSRSLTPFVKL